ncbi:hypothetical protein N752_13390 [Desulforamulus aquiferis]|nr:hypothetical protein N752_13390 [Desulforamulus aquiferis]
MLNCLMKSKPLNKPATGGFTLLEVLVAMALFTIFILAFIFVYGWSFENTFLMGEKSRAVAKAQEVVERLYIDINDPNIDLNRVTNPDDLYVYNEKGNYYVKEAVKYAMDVGYEEDKVVEGYNVTTVVFYKGGARYVEISNFILKESTEE